MDISNLLPNNPAWQYSTVTPHVPIEMAQDVNIVITRLCFYFPNNGISMSSVLPREPFT
jgi:hypothetical protein